jgi:hypothetical protein
MDANGDNVCVPCYGHAKRGITEANARLIAAATEMHALLVMLARAEEPMDVAELRGMAAQLLIKIDGGHS